MRTWSAPARAVVAGLGAAALVLLPAGPAAAGDAGGEVIRSYGVELEVRPDGSLRVAEQIDYDFGGNARHGIERDIDTEQRHDEPEGGVHHLPGRHGEQPGDDRQQPARGERQVE